MAMHSPITGSPASHPENLAERAAAIHTAAESIACLAELIAAQLGQLRTAVREHGTGVAELGDWHAAELLLNLVAEQAAIVTDAYA